MKEGRRDGREGEKEQAQRDSESQTASAETS